jgi:multicomponent Na+:H+ antiporter subunit G
MTAMNLLAVPLIVTGAVFYLAGTVGLLRFPNTLSRIHAITKADNLGLGFILLGLAIIDGSLISALKMLLIWLLVLVSSSTACYLIANGTLRSSR